MARRGSEEGVGSTGARRGSRGALVIVAVIAVVFAVALVVVLSQPSPLTQGKDFTTKVIGVDPATASVEIPIEFGAEGDPQHEVDHVFEQLVGMKGIAEATVFYDGRLVVRYDGSKVTAAQVRAMLAEKGLGLASGVQTGAPEAPAP